MTAARVNLLDLEPLEAEETLRTFAEAHGERAFRGSQALRHLWAAPAASFSDMTDLPKPFRALLEEHFSLPRFALETQQTSSDGTRKFLFRMHDGQAIESLTIRNPFG